MKYSLTRATPRNMRFVICQVCGFRRHIKDVTKVKDIHNRQYGLIVCKSHVDKPNPQDRPKIVNEKIVENLELMNPDPINDVYITNPLDDRLPGLPTNGKCSSDPFDGDVVLRWDAPLDQGSSPIRYYKIQRSKAQRLYYEDWVLNTGTNVPYYKDLITDPADYVSYRVAAVNGFGMGPYSDEFYWPTDVYSELLLHGTNYLMGEFEGYYQLITTGDGDPIIVGL